MALKLRFLLPAALVVALLSTVNKGIYARPGTLQMRVQDSVGCTFDSSLLAQLSYRLGVTIEQNNNIKLAQTIADWLGTPYRHAGYSKAGIDCSGFVSRIYKDVFGRELTHSAAAMINQMHSRISKDSLKEGDIVFFKINSSRVSHVGLYLKDHKFAHASLYRGIVIDDLRGAYYNRYYYAGGRAL